MKVNFFNQTEYYVRKYKKIIKKALKKESVDNKSMEVIFLNDEQIKELNVSFRNIDSETDVLSFPNGEIEDTSIGDVFINIDRAILQASEYGHSIYREMAFLAVHGYLHLLGYDHMDKEEEKIMFELQETILTNAKIERK